MRFDKEMKKIAYDLETGKGYNILQCVYCEENVIPTDEELAMVYVSKSEVIKLEYTYLMGGVKFNLYFAELIGHSLDDNMTQEVIQRVHRSSARANKEEKRELQKRKKYVQNIKG